MANLRYCILGDPAWEGIRGLTADECDDDLERMSQSWRLPDWDVMEGYASEVIESARRNGIEMKGSIVSGVALDDEYAEESGKLWRRLSNVEEGS
jgi:hypothetical protein